MDCRWGAIIQGPNMNLVPALVPNRASTYSTSGGGLSSLFSLLSPPFQLLFSSLLPIVFSNKGIIVLHILHNTGQYISTETTAITTNNLDDDDDDGDDLPQLHPQLVRCCQCCQ